MTLPAFLGNSGIKNFSHGLCIRTGHVFVWGTNPLSLAALDSSPEGRALGRTGEFRPYSSTAGRSQPISGKLYALAKASPFRERWHGEAVTERVASGTNPLSLAALDSSFPFLSPTGDIFPRPGEVFRRASPWQNRQVSSLFVNGRKKPAVKLQTFRLCQSLSLSGEVARRSRDGEGLIPERTLSVAYGDSSPEGRALGKEGKFRPHSSTAGGSQPISGKLFAFAKASPFRERWHGKAVTERVEPRLAAAFGKHFSQSESGQNRKKRLCRRHTARFCPGDLHFGVQGGTLVVPPAHRK